MPSPQGKGCVHLLQRREAGVVVKVCVTLLLQQFSGQHNPQYLADFFLFPPHLLLEDTNRSMQYSLDAAEAMPPKPPCPSKSEGNAVSLHSIQLKGFVFN